MKVSVCHPVSWKVNFRPRGMRSRPEMARRTARTAGDARRVLRSPQPAASRAPRPGSPHAGSTGMSGRGRGGLRPQLKPFAFCLRDWPGNEHTFRTPKNKNLSLFLAHAIYWAWSDLSVPGVTFCALNAFRLLTLRLIPAPPPILPSHP